MTVIGEGVIKVTADASGVAGGMASARAEIKNTADTLGKSMTDASVKAQRSIDAYIAKVEQSNAAHGKTQRELKLSELAQRGATQAQLQAADAALRTAEVNRKAANDKRQAARDERTAAAAKAAADAQAERTANSIAAAQAKAAAAAAKGTSGYFQLAAGQKLSAYQAQQLSFQLNDLFVQIASGQSPITALIQQGSQLNGQFGGITGTFRALGQAFKGFAAALLSPLGAIGAVVASIATLGFVFAKGAQQSADFAKAMSLTGNAAGITEGQFNASAQAIADSTNTTIGSSRETLQALAASGKLSGAALEGAGRSAQGLARITGQETSQIAQDFIQLASNVGRGAEDLNNKYNFLTATQLRYIKTLDDQGDSQRALAILFKELDNRVSASAQNLGYLETAWQKVKNAASGAIDAMLSIGRTATAEEKVLGIRKQLADLESGKTINRNVNPIGYEREKAALTGQLDALKEVERLGQRSATRQAESIERERAKTDFFKLQDTMLSRAEQRAKEIAKANALADKAGASAAERAKVIANINEKYKDPKGPKAPNTERVDARAALLLQIEDIKTAGAAIVEAFSNQERILEAKKSAALLGDAAYYAEKRRLVTVGVQAQIDAIEKENAVLEKQSLNTKDGLDRDRQVLKNKAEIAELQASSANQLEILSIQEQSAYKKIADAIIEARAAAQSYFDVTQRGYEQELANVGRGSRNRDTGQAETQIRERYEAQRQALAADLRRNQITKEQHDNQLQIINDFQSKAIQSYRDYYDQLDVLQADWRNGATEALQNYADESRNTADQIEKVFTDSFKGMEDALVDFVTTGKLNFTDLANSIVADITRIIVKQQITGPLAASLGGSIGGGGGGIIGSLFSSLFGGGFGSGLAASYSKANGGYAPPNSIQQVNERGPELLQIAGRQYLMMGQKGGQVTPNPGGGNTVNVNVNQAFGQGTSRATTMQAAADARRTLERAGRNL